MARRDRVQIQVRIPPAIRKRLQAESDRRMISKTLLIERALSEALDRWEKEPLGTLSS